MQQQPKNQIAVRVSIITIIFNIGLSIIKFLAGIIAHSGAMISDAVHSASDVFSTIIVIIGMHISAKESDSDHQYGHERFECVAAILLSVVLFATGLIIGYSGIQKIFFKDHVLLSVPGIFALMAAILSIVIKEAMYWYTRHYAKLLDSGALMADAWHHRSDALSSVGSFIGIIGARIGFPILDPIASVIICAFILKAAVDIFVSSVDKMTDHACDAETAEKILYLVKNQEGVLGVDQLKTRLFGDKIYVDIEICADGEKTLNETHAIAQAAHDKIEQEFPKVKHCMVHINPYNPEPENKDKGE